MNDEMIYNYSQSSIYPSKIAYFICMLFLSLKTFLYNNNDCAIEKV